MLHLDGAHSKSTLCDGVMILIVAKLGNGTQLHLGLAHVTVESSLFMVWIVLLLRCGGLEVEPIPVFSDRGFALWWIGGGIHPCFLGPWQSAGCLTHSSE
jgi:hypothetical protein